MCCHRNIIFAKTKDLNYLAEDSILGSDGNVSAKIGNEKFQTGYPPSWAVTIQSWARQLVAVIDQASKLSVHLTPATNYNLIKKFSDDLGNPMPDSTSLPLFLLKAQTVENESGDRGKATIGLPGKNPANLARHER